MINSHLCSIFYVPRSVLSILQSSSHLIHITTLRQVFLVSHFAEKKNEAKRGEVTCPRPGRIQESWDGCSVQCLVGE